MLIRKYLYILALIAGLSFASLLPCPLYAQETTGTISGTVTDPSGAVVPGATVVVTNVLRGMERTTTTTSAGIFFFTSLPVGDYQLSVETHGFKKYEASGIHLDVNDKLDFHVALEVGQVTESVTVTSEAPTLQTESGDVSNLIGAAQTQELPLNGRVFNQLVDLVPGVAPDNGRVGGGVGLFSDTAVSVNGNQSNSNSFLVDGQYDEDNGSNANLLVTPSVESIEEFKILRNNYSAEFGSATGAIVNIITKSGSKDFHGSLFEFLRNDALDSADFFLNSSNGKKSMLRQNNFGFTAGGPFWIPGSYNKDRSKDFFFVSTEWRRETRGNVATDNVPSARQRLGILDPTCAVTAPCTPQAFDPQEVPITNEPNVDPALINSNSTALLDRYPLPKASYQQLGFNWIESEPLITHVDQETVKWDHNIGEKATLMVRYMGMTQALGGINGQLWGDDNFPSVNSDWSWTGKNIVLKLTNMISPRTVNDFQFGYSNNAIRFQTGVTSDKTLASRAGFTYTELFPETSGSFPSMFGVENFGTITHTAPFYNRTDNFQIKDDVAHAFGKHNTKAGFYLRFGRKREPANGGDDETAGTLTFDTFQDLLLGNIRTYTEEQTLNEVPGRMRDLAFYVHDTWKAQPNLTLDYGVRWQFLSQIFSQHNNIASFYPNRYDPTRCSPAAFDAAGLVDPTLCDTLNGIVTPQSPGVPRALEQNHYRDWEPRLGFAWDPRNNKKLIIRGGVGIYHGRDAGSQTSALGRQPPFDRVPVLNFLTYSDLAPFNVDLPQPPVSLTSLDPVYFNPQSYQYSLGFQYELMRDTTLEINYVGSHQIHLGRNRDINQIPPQYQSDVYNGLNPDPVRPYLGYSIINMNERAAASRYNSLQAYVNHRMRGGLQFQAAYTYSHTIANTINKDTEARSSPVQDAYHPELERAVADQDQTHSLSINYIWQLPFFKNAHPLAKAFLGGWQLVGINTFRSGLPVNPCLDRDIDGTLSEACQRPNVVGRVNLAKSSQTLRRFFNTDAYVLQEPGTFGNAARNMVRGPGINNWDFSIFKNFDIPWLGRHTGWAAGESAKLQFRAEFFNGWNHTQFSGLDNTFVPTTDVNGNPVAGAPADPSSSFGTVNSARAPREIQLALKFIF